MRSRRWLAGGASASVSSAWTDVRISGVDVECRPWRAETEVEDLWPLDVGIMPLTDDPWAAGKCAMKAIQYLGVGVPAVVSPVGANREVVEDGVTGFHARTEDEWVQALERCLDDEELRRSHGRSGTRGCRRALLGRGAGAAPRRPVRSLADDGAARWAAGALRCGRLEPRRDLQHPLSDARSGGGFLVRVYVWTILLRYALAVLLNVFVVDSTFAAAFWGDSGSYDAGGYQLSLSWSGEPITHRLHVDCQSAATAGPTSLAPSTTCSAATSCSSNCLTA